MSPIYLHAIPAGYSEYLLYELISRIAHALGFNTRCDVPVDKVESEKGDNRRIDLLLKKGTEILCKEVK